MMELLEGEDMETRIARHPRLSIAAVATLVTQTAKALGAAHGAGIVHRDLKPANIFLARGEAEETVKILDFGVAAMSSLGEDLINTRGGTVLGTPHYMSPEQARSAKSLDYRSDLWSLGVVAYRALTGQHPSRGVAGRSHRQDLHRSLHARLGGRARARRQRGRGQPLLRARPGQGSGAALPVGARPHGHLREPRRRRARGSARQDPGHRRRAGSGAADQAALPPADPQIDLRVHLRGRRRGGAGAAPPAPRHRSRALRHQHAGDGRAHLPRARRRAPPAAQGGDGLGLRGHDQHPLGDEPGRLRFPRQAHRFRATSR